MAVPKVKTSKSKTKSRFASAYKATSAGISECPHCHELKKNHYVCPKCGYYDGQEKVQTAKKEKKDK